MFKGFRRPPPRGGSKGFWSGETLLVELPAYIDLFDPDRIDCSAYTLSMGRELYVSPTDESVDPQSVTIRQLKEGEGFTIPPGQFAFLLTEEIVEVPAHALAFISIKARIKWRGLINVSGFHVDPGFKGRLVFAVQNAGPVPVHLRQGLPLFLIWYAGLDQPTAMARRHPVQTSFPPDLISGISGELQSLAGVSKKIKELDKTITERVHAVEREQTYYRFIALIVVLLVGAMATGWIRDGGAARLFGGTRHPGAFAVTPAEEAGPTGVSGSPEAKTSVTPTVTQGPLPAQIETPAPQSRPVGPIVR